MVGGCQFEQFLPVGGHHILVGGNHVLPAPEGGFHVFQGRMFPSHQFHHDADVRIVDDVLDLVGGGQTGIQGPDFFRMTGQDFFDPDFRSYPFRDQVPVLVQHQDHAAPNGAGAQQSNVDLFHFIRHTLILPG